MSFEGLNPVTREKANAPGPTTYAKPFVESGHKGYMGLVESMANNQQDPYFMAHNRLAAARRFMPQDRANEIQQSVEGQYQNILGRESDPGGLAYWFNRQKRGSAPNDIRQVFEGVRNDIQANPDAQLPLYASGETAAPPEPASELSAIEKLKAAYPDIFQGLNI